MKSTCAGMVGVVAVMLVGAPVFQAAPPATVSAAGSMLQVGSLAPKITVEKWVKGQAVTSIEPGKVYVIEFWATWCAPCVANIPRLTSLQKKYPDVVIIGMASAETADRPPAPDRRLAKLEKFVRDQGDRMNYRIGYDGAGAMNAAWMSAAGQAGLPMAFIVGKDGRIAWLGNAAQLESELAKVVGR